MYFKVSSGEGLPADCGGGIRPPFARWGKWQIEYVQKELDVPFLNTCNEVLVTAILSVFAAAVEMLAAD